MKEEYTSRVHLAGMAAALPRGSRCGAAQQAARPQIETTKVRDGQRLHLPQRQSSVDVHRTRTRDATDPVGYGGPLADGLHRRDRDDKPTAPDLQPSPFRPSPAASCPRMAPHRGAPARQGARSSRIHTRRCPTRWSATATIKLGHHARAEIFRPQPFRFEPGDVAAKGEDRLHRRHDPGRVVPRPWFHRHLSARNRGVHQEGAGIGLGAVDPRSSRRARRPARHQEGRAGHPQAHAGSLGRDEEDGARRQVLGAGGKGLQAAELRQLAGL